MAAIPGMDPWVVTPQERMRHEEQFRSLKPVDGFVTGDQAKGFLLQSQLPPPVLGQIWGLADADADGRMSSGEFSVACKLISMKLRGFEVPKALPPSLESMLGFAPPQRPAVPPQPVLRQQVPTVGAPMPQPVAVPRPAVPPQPAMGIAAMPQVPVPTSANAYSNGSRVLPAAVGTPPEPMRTSRSASVTSVESAGSASSLQEWAVPHQSKLKYTQVFNTHDRMKSGFILGNQARSIMVQTQLPQAILAQIWGLSDLDSDGRLGSEEFVLAMHLCDMAKSGQKIPPALPANLIPPSFRRQRQDSLKLASPGSAGTPPEMTEDGRVTFEDKRKENFEKGQAELERRRRALWEIQKAEQEERERKEREEMEKRERIRLEQERRRQMELEKQLQKQREIEQQKEEERRKAEEQKQVARKEMERQRQLELENQRRQELLQRQQKQQETVLQLKARNQILSVELGQLNEKVKELSQKIGDTRTGVSAVKTTIDGMRQTRDVKLADMNATKNRLKDQNQRLLTLAQEKARIEAKNRLNESKGSSTAITAQMIANKQFSIKQLTEKMNELQSSIDQKNSDIDTTRGQLKDLKDGLFKLVDECKVLYEDYKEKREKVLEMRGGGKSWENAWDTAPAATTNGNEWGATDSWPVETPATAGDTGGVLKYRVLYEFKSRNPDELSFQPGDIIAVPEHHNAEPGWLAGELHGRKGWFPEAYVERINETASDLAAEAADTLQVKQPLEGIQEVPENVSDNGSLPGDVKGGGAAESPVAGRGQAVSNLEADVIYPCVGKSSKYLTLARGDVVTVTEQQDMWWYGESKGTAGWFPKSYVRLKGAEDTATGEYHIAVYPYLSAEPGDLCFQQGELVVVIKKDGDWWTGTVGDKTGIFPSNYVQKSEIEIAAPEPAVTQSSAPRRSTSGSISEEVDMSTMRQGKGRKPEIASVVAPYQATSPEQLSLQRGQLIMIRKKTSSGWWEGELQAKGKKRQVGWFPASYVKMLGSSSNRSTPVPMEMRDDTTPTQLAPGEKELVVALYTYEAEKDDELSFSKADVITVVAKPEPEWWRGELNGTTGMFPSNYVEPYSGGASYAVPMSNLSEMERRRQEHIHELIDTEQIYVDDISIINHAFRKPLQESGVLTNEEMHRIFVNAKEVMQCNVKLLKAFRVRKKMSQNGLIYMIGDILCENLVRMSPYLRFCSCQLAAAALIQHRTETSPEFCEVMRQCQSDSRTKGMPLSSFLIKPMQRITKYPLLIKKIMENTPQSHPDRSNMEEALTRAEDLCTQVNEGIRQKENSERLEWLQTHINCDGLEERLVFNSVTNAMGHRTFLHHGLLRKAKSGKELMAFLCNDFLLLAQPNKPLALTNQFSFERNQNVYFRIYRQPIFLNEMMVLADTASNNNDTETEFSIQTLSQLYTFAAPTSTERKLWLRKLEEARLAYLETEKCYLARQQSKQAEFVACGRLLISIIEGDRLKVQTVGKIDSYCEVSIGSQKHRSKVISGTSNPKWNASMQFLIKDLEEDVLCITVYDRDYFSPNEFLGRTEVRIWDILKEMRSCEGPITKRLLLHEVESGEVVVKLHLQLFENS